VQYNDQSVTSALTPWLTYVLIRDPRAVETTMQITKLLPLTDEVYSMAISLEKPRYLEDRIHYATMRKYGVGTIVSNDRDFDGLDVARIF